MSTSTSGRQSGRDKLAQLKAQEAREARQKKMLALVAGLVALVLVAVGVIWAIGNSNKSNDDKTATANASNTAFIGTLTSLPAATFDKVGAGTGTTALTSTGTSTVDKADGKPRVLYIGAEFCPYCAMERWPLVAALSRFGTFTGLKGAVSSPNEKTLANIQTLTFKDATYKSDYISFKAWETADRLGNALQSPTSGDTAIMEKYDSGHSIPFLSYGEKAYSIGATWDQGTSLPGMTNTEIVKAIADPSTDISKSALGAANQMTAEICTLTGQKPAAVCNSSGVKAAAAKLPN